MLESRCPATGASFTVTAGDGPAKMSEDRADHGSANGELEHAHWQIREPRN
jgi:hypothetical protein